MSDFNYLELIKHYIKIVYSEIMDSTVKKLVLSNLKQDIKSIFPDIYDSMEVEMHNIDSRLLVLLTLSIKFLLFGN